MRFQQNHIGNEYQPYFSKQKNYHRKNLEFLHFANEKNIEIMTLSKFKIERTKFSSLSHLVEIFPVQSFR